MATQMSSWQLRDRAEPAMAPAIPLSDVFRLSKRNSELASTWPVASTSTIDLRCGDGLRRAPAEIAALTDTATNWNFSVASFKHR